MAGIEVRSTALARAQAEEAGNVLSRAFWDDPMITWLMPDEAHRAVANPAFFHMAARLGLNEHSAWTTFGKPDGAAIWMPPGKHDLTDDMMGAAGFLEAVPLMGDETMGRFGTLMGAMNEQHESNMKNRPHWFLLVLGVEPARQGQGVGGDLIQPILQRADLEGLPCYLETMKTKNLPFYRKHGFEVVSELDIDDGGPHTWCMRRDPKTS